MRLNRATAQRAAFWALGSALLGVAFAAAAASRLAAAPFRLAVGAAAAAVAAIAVAAALRARARWADAARAARWVESRVPLDERLLTLVTARPEERSSRLWPLLEADNQEQLARWRSSRLGIPRVAGNVSFLAVAAAAALAALVPRWDAAEPPQDLLASAEPAPEPGRDGTAPPPGGGGMLRGAAPGEPGAGDATSTGMARVAATVDVIHADLAERFNRSIAGGVINRAPGSEGPPAAGDDSRLAARGDAPRGGVGQTKGDEGGRPPDPSLMRLEQDDGTGQPVRGPESEEGSASGRPSQPGAGPNAEARDGAPADDKGGPGAGKPLGGGRGKADGPLVNKDSGGGSQGGSGGGGAGAGKGSGPLLAQKPLTVGGDAAGGRQTARFALTIGAGTRDVGPGDEDGVPAQPRSRIADVARGAQAADRSVRHEQIPPEYEGAIKRIFARDK